MKKNVFGICLLLFMLAGCSGSSNQAVVNSAVNTNPPSADTNARPSSENTPQTAPGKTYAQMSDDDKTKFIIAQSDKILENFGRAEGDAINEIGIKMIKDYVDGYAARRAAPKTDKCSLGNDINTILTRGGNLAKTVNDEFRAAQLPAYLGIYMAMIETEYCPCLKSGTGALGIFQFGKVQAEEFGLKTQNSDSAAEQDERCNPQLASRAAAKYIKDMLTRDFPTNAVGYPLIIASYNSGQANIKSHISDIAAINKNENVSFWTLLETENKMPKNATYSKQFQMENKKYVPKFFAAAIIGENPGIFGVDLPPLSTFQK